MASQIERVVTELRRRIVAGQIAPGERIVELQFADDLKVSRTPLRLALGELEKEGLLERLPTRGFRVRQVTLQDIADAIDVRGVLEGMAVRKLAETGATRETVRELKLCLAEGQALLDAAQAPGPGLDALQWANMNARFHQTILQGADNAALTSALAHVSRIPMAAPGALGLSGLRPTQELAFLQRAQMDHEDVVRAIEAHEGARAEALMREHARRSRDNKRTLLESSGTIDLPLISL